MKNVMLQPNTERLISTGDGELPHSASPAELIDLAFAFIRRQYWVVLLALLGSVTLGFVYLMITPPSFLASASMIIDTRKNPSFQQQAVLGEVPIDSAWIESQITTIKSENVASAVIKKLHLTEDPEFVGSGGGGPIHGLIAVTKLFWRGSGLEESKPKSDNDLMRQAVFAFGMKLDA